MTNKYNEQIDKAKKTAEEYWTKGVRKTRELKFYLLKFALRIAIFLCIFFTYLTRREWLEDIAGRPFGYSFTMLHVLWIIFMCTMIRHLIPNNRLTMAWKKARENEYRPVDNYEELQLYKYLQKQNVGAWRVMLVWLSFNAVWGALYLFGIISEVDLIMLSVFYFLCDYICILLFCPFQTFLMKNKCCINCRIYDWGHFMMFTPMLFIRNFYSWSLFFTSIVVVINWEIRYSKHPERFWEGSNRTLQCKNCKERTCQIKRTIASKK
ncbi:MAG: hypothetical protein IKN54_10115 [Lachnospiraceae bacterium]|nr:hypothetical protein [Lachnospiraceae bacterium]